MGSFNVISECGFLQCHPQLSDMATDYTRDYRYYWKTALHKDGRTIRAGKELFRLRIRICPTRSYNPHFVLIAALSNRSKLCQTLVAESKFTQKQQWFQKKSRPCKDDVVMSEELIPLFGTHCSQILAFGNSPVHFSTLKDAHFDLLMSTRLNLQSNQDFMIRT